ncbi:hypothetical protein [Leifsonia sp. Root112D2]|nr:hypothetical protein [Leifsonia sp. Root112D2]
MNSADGLSPTTRPGGAIDPASVSLPPTRIVDLTAATHSDVAIVAPDER